MQLARKLVEAQSDDGRHSCADHQRLARAQRRQEGELAAPRVGDRGADDFLVVFMPEPHREHGTALRDQRGIELMRALSDQAQENAVLAAFLGDTRQPLACRRENRSCGRR